MASLYDVHPSGKCYLSEILMPSPGKVYGIPLNAEKLLVFDPKIHDSSASRPKSSPSKSDGLSGVETGHVATGKLKWLAGLSLGGKARWVFLLLSFRFEWCLVRICMGSYFGC